MKVEVTAAPRLALAGKFVSTSDDSTSRILPRGHYRTSMRLLLAWLACVPSAAALVASGSTYSRLQAVQVTRASDAQTLGLTSLWGESDRAALFFLRHFG